MKRVSFWALHHKIAARIIIVLIYFLLNLLGLFCGDLLSSLNIVLSPAFYLIAILLTLGGIIFYPSKKRKHAYKNFYLRQKLADGFLITATFLFIIYSGNSFNYTRTVNPLNHAFAISIVQSPLSLSISHDNSVVGKKSSLSSKKEKRMHVRSFIKEIRKKYKATSDSGKAVLIAL